jgi:hypothetical protein
MWQLMAAKNFKECLYIEVFLGTKITARFGQTNFVALKAYSLLIN